jgi:hypothetical protein
LSWIAKGCFVLGGILALVALAWMAFLPAAVEHELRTVTGFDVHVSSLSANPFTGRVVARGFTASNPATYPKPDFIEVRRMRAEMNLFSLAFSERIRINDLDLDVDRIELIRRHDGRSNAGDFMAAFIKPSEPSSQPTPLGKRTHYFVKTLHLRLDRLVVADYTGSKSYEKSYDLRIDQTYTDVIDSRQLLTPDVVKRIHSFGLHHEVSELLPGDFGRALADAVGGMAQVEAKVQETVIKTGDAVKGALDKLDQSPKP